MKQKNVTFFGANWCAYCVQLRSVLDKEGIVYDYKSVDKEDNEAAMLEASDGRYLIPTLVIDNETYQNPPGSLVKELLT